MPMGAHFDGRACATWMSRAQRNIGSYVSTALHQSVVDARTHARTTNAYKSHTYGLRNSIQTQVLGPWEERLRANAPYAMYVENGTKPHVIEAKGKALRFELNGETVFRKRVNHPGSKPRYFIRDASLHVIPVLLARLCGAVARLP